MCDKQKNIKDDPYFIMELETGYVILGWFQRFKGYTVFNCKEHGPELHNLEHSFKIKHVEGMYEQHLKFVDFAASRSLSRIEQWGETLVCPVIRIDGTENWHTNVAKIAEQYLLNE